MTTPHVPQTFASLDVPEPLVRALAAAGLTTPTPIQAATIPVLLAGDDVVAGAPTGSGKTLAFGLPLLAARRRGHPFEPAALVLTPTRELAAQIERVLSDLGSPAGTRTLAVYGGVGMGPQRQALRRGVDVLVATPGRLEDLLGQGALRLSGVRVLVIDEADRMADVGFLPAVRRVLAATEGREQTVLFSATTDAAVTGLIREHLPTSTRVDVESTPVDESRTTHLFWRADHPERLALTASVVQRSGRTIVFTRTKRGADRIARQLHGLGVAAAAMHGDRSQAQRDRALDDFHAGRVTALVATDVAARGIHVDSVRCVVHFDPPEVAADFTHRSGRTARAGASGLVVTLVPPDKTAHVRRLQRQLGRSEPVTTADLELVPEHPPVVATAASAPRADRPRADGARRRPRPSAGARAGGTQRPRRTRSAGRARPPR